MLGDRLVPSRALRADTELQGRRLPTFFEPPHLTFPFAKLLDCSRHNQAPTTHPVPVPLAQLQSLHRDADLRQPIRK